MPTQRSRLAMVAVSALMAIAAIESFQPIIQTKSHRATISPTFTLRDRNSLHISPSALFGKKKKGGGGGGGKPRGQQQAQEKQSVKDARFDAATRQFMFTLVGLTKMLPDKSKKILDNIHLR
jgi:sulfate-transporting ATPase